MQGLKDSSRNGRHKHSMFEVTRLVRSFEIRRNAIITKFNRVLMIHHDYSCWRQPVGDN